MIVAFFAATMEKLGFFAIGALGGSLLGMILYATCLHYISSSELMLYLPAGILAVGLGMLGLFLRDYVAIFITSFIGSYLLVRFISFFAGGFPNEFVLA